MVSKHERIYGGIDKNLVLEIYSFVIKLRNENETKIGQSSLVKKIKEKFNINLSESTISGWIHRQIIPYENEKTQFKPKIVPPRAELYRAYIDKKLSASKIAKNYKVSTIIVINWLKKYKIQVRSHREAMNTENMKIELGNQKLIFPLKDYKKLTPDKAYILGVLAGDGHINKKFLALEIKYDIEFIEEFSRCLEAVYGIKYNYRYCEDHDSYKVYAASKVICWDLLGYGNFGTYVWTVPEFIFDSNSEVIGSYLRGLFDSEGSVSKYCISFSSISKFGIFGVQQLLSKLNIKSSVSCQRSRYYGLFITNKENRKRYKALVGFTIRRKLDGIR